MSKNFEKIKAFYTKKLWNAEQVETAKDKGIITEEEYHLIVDEKESEVIENERVEEQT